MIVDNVHATDILVDVFVLLIQYFMPYKCSNATT